MRTIKRKQTKDPQDGQALSSLKHNKSNPRKPWAEGKSEGFAKSLAEFGDLSGIVLNTTTKQLVGGHKRIEAFRADADVRVIVTERLAKPDAVGTVAYGHLTLSNGTRFAYREVKWTKGKEAAGNLAANKWDAGFNLELVPDMLALADAGGFALGLTGFDESELAALGKEESGGQREAPSEFNSVGEDVETQYECPHCHYAWSGKPKPDEQE